MPRASRAGAFLGEFSGRCVAVLCASRAASLHTGGGGRCVVACKSGCVTVLWLFLAMSALLPLALRSRCNRVAVSLSDVFGDALLRVCSVKQALLSALRVSDLSRSELNNCRVGHLWL